MSRGVGSLLRVTLEDGSKFTGTASHPIWSVDAGDWNALDEFSLGESLLGIDGSVSIALVAPVRQPADVFNIEVDGTHVYRIVEAGILIHNADCEHFAEWSLFGVRGKLLKSGDEVSGLGFTPRRPLSFPDQSWFGHGEGKSISDLWDAGQLRVGR